MGDDESPYTLCLTAGLFFEGGGAGGGIVEP